MGKVGKDWEGVGRAGSRRKGTERVWKGQNDKKGWGWERSGRGG